MPTSQAELPAAVLAPIGDHAEDRYEGQNVPVTRKVMPKFDRVSFTHEFVIIDQQGHRHKGYVTAGLFDDGEMSQFVRASLAPGPLANLAAGSLGEIFIRGFGKEGSTMDGFVNWGAMSFSMLLQFGMPIEMLEKFCYLKFPPFGPIRDQAGNIPIPYCHSIPAYICEWLGYRFGPPGLHDKMVEIRESLN